VKSAGGVAFKKCPTCWAPVLSAYRGEVTAVGKSEILSVTREGHIIGKCNCGKQVVWEREVSRTS
jgi:hypothetical protein